MTIQHIRYIGNLTFNIHLITLGWNKHNQTISIKCCFYNMVYMDMSSWFSVFECIGFFLFFYFFLRATYIKELLSELSLLQVDGLLWPPQWSCSIGEYNGNVWECPAGGLCLRKCSGRQCPVVPTSKEAPENPSTLPLLPIEGYHLEPPGCSFVYSEHEQLHIFSLATSLEMAHKIESSTKEQSSLRAWHHLPQQRIMSGDRVPLKVWRSGVLSTYGGELLPLWLPHPFKCSMAGVTCQRYVISPRHCMDKTIKTSQIILTTIQIL